MIERVSVYDMDSRAPPRRAKPAKTLALSELSELSGFSQLKLLRESAREQG
jgi:hypothetical protein